MIFGKPPDHLIKVATLIKDFWKLWVAPVARWGRSGTPGRRGCWRGRRGTG